METLTWERAGHWSLLCIETDERRYETLSIMRTLAKRGGMGIAAGAVINAGMTYSTYKTDRARGVNPLVAGAHGIAQTILTNEFMGPLIAMSALPLLPMAAQNLRDRIGDQQRSIMPMNPWNTTEADSADLQTTRQRALEAIQNSKLNARTYIGAEAGLFAARYR